VNSARHGVKRDGDWKKQRNYSSKISETLDKKAEGIYNKNGRKEQADFKENTA
jgi:hypothetical protein